LFRDPYAARFLGWDYRVVVGAARIAVVGLAIERYIDRRYPAGPRGSAIARTRLIDDLVEDAVAAGAEQVVLLGAGHDSRAYRLASMRQSTVFEVDHPVTQTVKRARVLRYVPAEHRDHGAARDGARALVNHPGPIHPANR
jgi:methyltransferase (TIGR00027 family)